MELKFFTRILFATSSVSSNRTFMELKFESRECAEIVAVSSNRTFMELKYDKININTILQAVLIVPLWN